ncbi:hypothetical protein GW755_01425 [bacterium]|nr:hypothetical protein [bacterium]
MLGQLKKTGQMIQQQKQFFDLQKKLGNITIEVEEGNVKLILKGAVTFFKIDSVEVDGEPNKNFTKAMKKGEKLVLKQLQKLQKSGELKDFNMM